MKTPEYVDETVQDLSPETVEIARRHGADITLQGDPSPASMLQAAIERGIDPDGLEKLAALFERFEDRRASREFSAALLAFQNSCPNVAKVRRVKTGKYSYDYAPLDYMANVIRPHLDRCGLSFTVDVSIEGDRVTVRTVIRHTGGHQESTTFTAPIDSTAAMNAPQKVASAVSYARRYGLMLALGIVSGGEDDDGSAAGTTYITDEQLNVIQSMVEDLEVDRARFLKWLGVDQLGHLPERDYTRAYNALCARAKEQK